MESMLRLSHLKISLLFLLSPILTWGQVWELVEKIPLNKEPACHACDFQGNFYVGFADGTLTKYDNNGSLLENYSLPNTSKISLIDVQNNLKPFLFYLDNQEIKILDRFSSVPKVYPLSTFGIQFGMMACPAPDGDIWIAENNPQRLKKINPNLRNTLLEVQVVLGDSIQKMLAYQNFLFVGTSRQVYAFDQFGSQLYAVEEPKCLGFQIDGDLLLVFNQTTIIEVNFETGQIINAIALPIALDGVCRTKKGLLGIKGESLFIYQRPD